MYTRCMLVLLLCMPPFVSGCGCDSKEKDARIATLEETLKNERIYASKLDHARRLAVEETRVLRNDLQAERTRRGWSDTYAIGTAGAYLVALGLAGLLLWWRRRS